MIVIRVYKVTIIIYLRYVTFNSKFEILNKYVYYHNAISFFIRNKMKYIRNWDFVNVSR